jgi:hypothetical protein
MKNRGRKNYSLMKMSEKIKIYTRSSGDVSAEISLERNPTTAKAILDVLLPEENSQQDVEIGDLGYWPQGNGFCLFFGRTPISIGDKPKAASPVNVFGRILEDPTVFRKTKIGEEIRIEREYPLR